MIRAAFYIMGTLFLGLLLYLASFFFFPSVAPLTKENPRKTAFMEYREKEWRRAGKHLALRQHWVPLGLISPYLVKAVIIAEDDKFWSHEGFDFEAIQKAVEKDLKAKKFKWGASTISQQLAKNLYLTPSKNPIRKLKEAILTWRLERTLSKKRIIELYLNVVEWGEGIFGAEAAARRYYGKPAAALGADEAARLAVVLPNPLRWNPTGNSRYVLSRSRVIQTIMIRRGIIIPDFEEVMKKDGDSFESLPSGSSEPLPAVEKEMDHVL
jgi:monofunctional biosynthetic peptidoglycan transglycosylase